MYDLFHPLIVGPYDHLHMYVNFIIIINSMF